MYSSSRTFDTETFSVKLADESYLEAYRLFYQHESEMKIYRERATAASVERKWWKIIKKERESSERRMDQNLERV